MRLSSSRAPEAEAWADGAPAPSSSRPGDKPADGGPPGAAATAGPSPAPPPPSELAVAEATGATRVGAIFFGQEHTLAGVRSINGALVRNSF